MVDQDQNSNPVAEGHKSLWDQGIKIRQEVLGQQHVAQSLGNATPFSSAMQEYATEVGWG